MTSVFSCAYRVMEQNYFYCPSVSRTVMNGINPNIFLGHLVNATWFLMFPYTFPSSGAVKGVLSLCDNCHSMTRHYTNRDDAPNPAVARLCCRDGSGGGQSASSACPLVSHGAQEGS